MLKCLIVDFDNTIINTLPLLEARKKRDWAVAKAGLLHCTPHQSILNALNTLHDEGILIAIFSNSPEPYVRLGIDHFKIPCDYLVAYHDVKSHKPSPEGVQKILERYSLETSEVIYIGDEEIDLQTSKNGNVAFAGVGWGNYNDIHQVNVLGEEVLDSIRNFAKTLNHNSLLIQEGIYYYLGYYQDPIKNRLLDFKSNKTRAIAEWNALLNEYVQNLPEIDVVVRALGHTELESKEEQIPLDVIAESIAKRTASNYIPKLLRKRALTRKSTTLGQSERLHEIDKKYFIDSGLSTRYLGDSQSVLVVDDVMTTGATTREIIRAIHEVSPGSKCYILTLVRTSYSDSYTDAKREHNEKLLQAFIDLREQWSKNKFYNKAYSANYTHSNHNFMIQNLYVNTKNIPIRHEQYIPGICIIKNLLQRGKPTLMSKYLQSHLGPLHKDSFFTDAIALIDAETPVWEHMIRGDAANGYYPAKRFVEEILPRHFSDYTYIQPLLLPEMPINDITQVYNKEYENQQVDFYLSQAALVIEIDGSQHQLTQNVDGFRDNYLRKYGIEVIRISVSDMELENSRFHESVSKIKNRVDHIAANQSHRSYTDSSLITLGHYKKAYSSYPDLTDKHYMATAVMRMQLLILELLENGIITFDNDWNFEIKSEMSGYAEIAIEDLFLWFHHLYKLQKITFVRPAYSFRYLEKEAFSISTDVLKIDFSIFKRYTDEYLKRPDIIFVRTHYLDEYQYFKQTNGNQLAFVDFMAYDFFRMSTAVPVNYRFQFGDEGSDSFSLLYFLENIFLQEIPNLDFNEGQLPIIANALSGNDTIGLLPTGSGKSVCYQLAALLQPAISFVVCPIKSLMYDQKMDLDTVLFTRTNYITSDMEPSEKEIVSKEYSSGKYFFVFISPERFQIKGFRSELEKINQDFHYGYAVIDEVHCLSEWGHDFRTSYLNLSNTINKFSPFSKFIGLTATASVNVLKDIQNEFSISQMDVKTPLHFTRKELDFDVIDDGMNKQGAIINLLQELNEEWNIFDPEGKESKCGIIFTSTVNGPKGCYQLSQRLSSSFNQEVFYYSGSVPTDGQKRPVMPEKEFDRFKREVQDRFKNNEFTLLAATKAFGMGVNKGNIHYTIHYGLPSSMESLYQEAGRAGRDKQKFADQQAKCLVLLSKEPQSNDKVLEQLWNPKTILAEIKELTKVTRGDINTNLFMFSNSLDTIKDEFKLINDVYERYCTNKDQSLVRIDSRTVQNSKAKVEKAIYRLNQLGIIKDWTIENFFSGMFEAEINDAHTPESVESTLMEMIHKYEKDFSLAKYENDTESRYYTVLYKEPQKFTALQKSILVLLIWSYDHFAYNRRQSLKNVYENCLKLSAHTSDMTKEKFKEALENYFRFDESSYVLQYIADNPYDFEPWFEIFLEEDKLIDQEKLTQLKDQLSRFLESYMAHPGLDMISGVVRLLLDDFENADGASRLYSAISKIKNNSEFDQAEVLAHLIGLVQQFDKKKKAKISKILLRHFDSLDFKINLYDQLEDDYSLAVILDGYTKRLKNLHLEMEDAWQI